MRKIRFYGNDLHFWREIHPSKSFLKKLSLAITEQLPGFVNIPEYKTRISDIVEVQFDHFNRQYDLSKPFVIPLHIMDKNSPLIIATCFVIWNLTPGSATLIYPWDDVTNIPMDFAIKMSKDEIKAMNYLLPLLHTPIVLASESGLPYDYQVKNRSTDGKLKIYPVSEFPPKVIEEISKTITDFRIEHDLNNESKIHYIGDLKKTRKGTLTIVMDFASCPEEVIVNCIQSLKGFVCIKKIVYI